MSELELAEPRQMSGDLQTALAQAVMLLRARALEYRNPRSTLDKIPRRRLAAEYNDWARAIESHAAALRARTTGTMGEDHRSHD